MAPGLAGLLLRLVGAEVVTLGRWCREFVLAKLRGALDAIGLAETSWPPREHVLAARLLSDQSGSPFGGAGVPRAFTSESFDGEVNFGR